MKKVVRMSLLALTAVALLGSCKKKNNEPTPTPTPTPVTPATPASVITLSIPAGQKFGLKGIEGENITIGGVPVENLPYNASNPEKEFTSQTGTIEVKGNIKSLTLSSGTLNKLEIPNGLEVLRLLSGSTVKVLELAQAKSLKQLSINESGITNNPDLSQLNKLENVFIRKAGGVFTLPTSVRSLRIEEHIGLQNQLTLAAFPNLESLLLIGSAVGKDVDFSGSTKLKTFLNSRSVTPQITLKNCSALANVLLRDMNGTTSVDLSSCPLLKEGTIASLTSFKGFTTNENSLRLTNLNLSGASLEKFNSEVCTMVELTTLDLSRNKLSAADFSRFSKLKNLNLLGNTTLTGGNLTTALNSLPTVTGGTLKIAGLSASDRAIATGKGWNVVAQ